jgi:transposase-like protein
MANPRAEHDDFMARSGRVLEIGVKFKKVMLESGLTSAKAKCPLCEEGHVHGRLAGRKNHFRMWCDSCDVGMME